MDFKEYFQNELVMLRELGRDAARRNAALAPFLATPGRDVDVEKLLESFAFLSGRVRQKLDDELPEITHELFSRLWPNYLRPLPAATVIQYRPTENTTGQTLIPKGTLVHSVPVDGTSCAFKTVYDTAVLPLEIAGQWFIEGNGETALALRFIVTNGELGNLALSGLRFFFTGKADDAYSIYFTLLHQVKEIRVVIKNAEKERRTAVLEASALRAVGFGEGEGLYPYPAATAAGYRILQEYFCFPEKFLFVELNGLEEGTGKKNLQEFQGVDGFELHFVLKEAPKDREAFHKDNWQLFCTPAVNLFPVQAAPQVLSEPGREFRVVPVPERPNNFAVYSVDQVCSWTQGAKGQINYENSISAAPFGLSRLPAYHLNIRPVLGGEDVETYITLNADNKAPLTVGLELTCTNRMLPRRLKAGDISSLAGSKNNSALPFKNILPVTSPFPPPLQADLLWRLLSAMTLNYIPLSDLTSFKALLSTYNFRAMHDHKAARALERTLQGITSIKSVETDRIFKGIAVRGLQTRVELNPDCFSCEGELYMFGAVINEFLSLCATVNSFQQTIIISKSKEYKWPARLGGHF